MMSQLRRQLLLAVVDDQPGLAEQLYVFTQFIRCDELLSWLIDNNITGKNFQDWVKSKHHGSTFSAAKFVLTRVKERRPTELLPVIAGRDFLARRLA
jgi:dTDP-glucose pyrophosphorylase